MSGAEVIPTNVGSPATETIRLRADLQIHRRQRSGRRQYWLANPISGRVVRLTSPDFDHLTGAASRSVETDPSLVAEAKAAGLIAGVWQTPKRSRTAAWWRNPLYIRLRGMPADGVARFLAGRTSWLFSATAVKVWMAAILLLGLVLLAHGRQLALSFNSLLNFQAKHWGIVLATLAVTKMIHELAHATVCRRMGAAVREIGVLLLCGTPCLYCDVTDSWRVESRFSRAAIMLAGVYVELVLAALAAVVWLLSDDGLLRMAALNLICVCGVSTVVFNINPLMRYDGYFVLADYLDVPNLRSRAADVWRSLVVRRWAGRGYSSGGAGAAGVGSWGLALYHAASTGYRYVVLSLLAGWFYLVLSRAGIEAIGRTAIVIAVVAVVTAEMLKLRRVVMGRGGWRGVSRWRRSAVAGLWLSLGLLLLFVPVQRRVTARGTVELQGAANVYAPRDGRVESVDRLFGARVQRGETLAVLDEPAMRVEQARLASQIARMEIRRAALKRRALAHPEMLVQLEEQSAAITATKNQLLAVTQGLDEMTLTAPRDGTVLPYSAPSIEAEAAGATTASSQLSDRSGQTVAAGSVWCCIGDESRKQVVLEVDASRRRFVEAGGEVRIQIDQSPADIITCQVADVSAMRQDPRSLTDFAPKARFTVACVLPEEIAERVRIGATATGVIRGEPLRLWDWCLRRVSGSAF